MGECHSGPALRALKASHWSRECFLFFSASNESPHPPKKMFSGKEPPMHASACKSTENSQRAGQKLVLRGEGETAPTPRALCPAAAATLVPGEPRRCGGAGRGGGSATAGSSHAREVGARSVRLGAEHPHHLSAWLRSPPSASSSGTTSSSPPAPRARGRASAAQPHGYCTWTRLQAPYIGREAPWAM